MASLPQYYNILNVSPTATADEIRAAYKRESLRTHPDRLPGNATAQQKRKATEKFQAVADAYYVLSDPARRAEYDSLFHSRPPGAFTDDGASEYEQDQASSSFFQNFSQYFGNSTNATGNAGTGQARPDPNGVFGDVFEEMLAPEVANVRPWWGYLGGASGAVMGYIVANVPGAIAGGFAGNRLGSIRDAKGKSVAQVFAGLGHSQKAEILRALAFKVLGSMQ
ncbi:DnaJ domain-containing protein [Kockovaella imperatae]|uniref:DnaJ domain-containing protein n=1 Tax=Kockovaella imperatae TaxID=4999 RepID=A0A1Y1UH25_9TREE|nr:DnaJ domain-containing protein [Kockovaella imperatae]ORX37350.1 DnaJ domain-containing protein [Kockovaella imperatae]